MLWRAGRSASGRLTCRVDGGRFAWPFGTPVLAVRPQAPGAAGSCFPPRSTAAGLGGRAGSYAAKHSPTLACEENRSAKANGSNSRDIGKALKPLSSGRNRHTRLWYRAISTVTVPTQYFGYGATTSDRPFRACRRKDISTRLRPRQVCDRMSPNFPYNAEIVERTGDRLLLESGAFCPILTTSTA